MCVITETRPPTSSNTISGSAAVGSGVSPKQIGFILGIVKAYTTRVGSGPFPSEQDNDIGQKLGQGITLGQIDISQLSNGIYYIKLEKDNKSITRKIIKN